MPFADIEAKTVINGFTDAEKTSILNDLKTAYDGSAIAKTMMDDWIAAGNTIQIDKVAGVYRAFTGTGKVEIDPDYIDGLSYITVDGKAQLHSQLGALVHELGHALTGRRDNYDLPNDDFMGDNVRFINTIWDQLGLPLEVSYVAQSWDAGKAPVAGFDLHKSGYEYTNGTAINGAITNNAAVTSTNATNDLLIGGPAANKLESGPGRDFLVGAGGDDELNGGAGDDTAVYFGDPLDYDIRLQADGSWTVRHVRGAKDEGNDTVKNAEHVQFDGGETYDLEKKGLTFQKDFALVIDTTGSMGPHINGVKAQAVAITDALFDGATDARIGVVGYKDETIGELPSIILPFTDHDEFADRKAAAIAAINGITVGGGGDLPETYYGGLLAALDGRLGEWRPGAGTLRIAAFTDAAAKDGHLFAQVAALAADLGVTLAGSSSLVGAHSAIDTFELSFPAQPASGTEGLTLPDDGDPLPTFDPRNDPIAPDSSTARLEIYSIFTGSTGVDTSELESIADETGGAFLTATTPEELVTALIDIIEAPTGLVGTPGDDVLVGGPEDDTITGLGGNDRLVGRGGNDIIEGNEGNDILLGRSGDDELFGGRDNDVLRGGRGSDFAAGGRGNDRLYGGPGDDQLLGGPGNDVLRGGPGADELRGGSGHDNLLGGFDDDLLFGGRGNDKLSGFRGNDELRGGPGDDELRGGFGDDLVAGGRGDDLLFGGPGSDRLFGGPGSDAFIFGDSDDLGTGPAKDVAIDFEAGIDALNLSHVDADITVDGDQAFSFIGAAAFSAAGQVRYESGLLSGDVDGDGVADFEIAFANSALLTSDDMLL